MSQELQADTARDNPVDTTPEAVSDTASQPMRTIRRDGVDYTLIGTAHVSRASAEAVRELSASGDFEYYRSTARPVDMSSGATAICRWSSRPA